MIIIILSKPSLKVLKKDFSNKVVKPWPSRKVNRGQKLVIFIIFDVVHILMYKMNIENLKNDYEKSSWTYF